MDDRHHFLETLYLCSHRKKKKKKLCWHQLSMKIVSQELELDDPLSQSAQDLGAS